MKQKTDKLVKLEQFAHQGKNTDEAVAEMQRIAESENDAEAVGKFDEKAVADLAKSLSVDVAEITDFKVDSDDGGTFKAEGVEYRFFWTEDVAERVATEQVHNDLENEPELFNQEWLNSQIDEGKARDFFSEVYNEWNQSYATDIDGEPSHEGLSSRLADELVERQIVDKDEALAEGFDAQEHIDAFVEKMTEDQIREGMGGYDYYVSNFGEDEAKKLVMKNNLIDIDAAAEDAVSTDGWAHFLSHYSGDYETTEKGLVYFRE
jgi:hypothetical protein